MIDGCPVKGEEMSELEPTPELPDNVAIREVRETSDEALLSLPEFGKASVAHLRETLGLPSTDGVRPLGKKPGE
jgi:hypothetical protein